MLKIRGGTPFPLGVSQTAEGVQFAFYGRDAKSCSLHLFKQGEIAENQVIAANQAIAEDQVIAMEDYRIGDVFTICLIQKRLKDLCGYQYAYILDGKVETDPYAKAINGRENWGIRKENSRAEGVIYSEAFDWEGERAPRLSYSNLYPYQLHVRGFTKHNSSKVKAKGTFLGICEKIPYLQDLGINALFLLPCYEFDEVIFPPLESQYEKLELSKIDYWGYEKQSFYFTPKSSYAKNPKNPQREMKEMVKALHKAQIEVIMDMYFPEGMNPILILDCLRFWITEYHVDGFHLNRDLVPITLLAKDPLIGGIKLWASYWDTKEVSKKGKDRRFAEINDGFLINSRKYLKSDEGQVGGFINCFRKNPEDTGVINYIANVNSLTLMDMVSYDIKHNEDNGEQGKDGPECNYSWNCGVEGNTRRKQVLSLRSKQIRNALLMLYFSQGTPMLLSGDEFGNSQGGNNNPYCQDNSVTWLNWKDIYKNADMYEFTKDLIAFRKKHPILHCEEELKGIDYMSSGCPDISFHGTKAWYVDDSNYSRLLGILLNGEYKRYKEAKGDDSFYIAFNMHWETHRFDLPKLVGKKQWRVKYDTSQVMVENSLKSQREYLVNARTIVVFQSAAFK